MRCVPLSGFQGKNISTPAEELQENTSSFSPAARSPTGARDEKTKVEKRDNKEKKDSKEEKKDKDKEDEDDRVDRLYTLLEAIDSFASGDAFFTSFDSTSSSTSRLRLPVTDAFPSGGNTIVSGKLMRGTLTL